MDFRRNAYGQWRSFHKKVKLRKKVVEPLKLFKKALETLRRVFSSTAAPAPAPAPAPVQGNLVFMSCILRVKSCRPGWERAVLAVLKNCQEVRFQMDLNRMIQVNGIANPDKLLRRIGRSRRIELQWIQFGQCSTNLFMPPQTKKEENPPPPPYARNGL